MTGNEDEKELQDYNKVEEKILKKQQQATGMADGILSCNYRIKSRSAASRVRSFMVLEVIGN